MIDACPEPAVLFFDVDGTLTSFDPDDMTDKDFSAVRPSQAVIEAFHTLRDAGHKAFICTGRPLWLIADSLRELDPEGIVAMAGATLEVEGRVVHEDCFDEDIVEELAPALRTPASRPFRGQRCNLFDGAAGVERPF
ncbi:MAG: HAD hydrolase family protein [Collinsella sp.]